MVESNPDAMMKDKMNMFGSKGDLFLGGGEKWGQLKTGDFCAVLFSTGMDFCCHHCMLFGKKWGETENNGTPMFVSYWDRHIFGMDIFCLGIADMDIRIFVWFKNPTK